MQVFDRVSHHYFYSTNGTVDVDLGDMGDV